MGLGTAIRVLNVDDDPGQRYATSRVLREAGYDVVEASSGREALTLARTKPELIVLDVHLPDIDGFEVCRQIKENPETANMLVVQVSAIFDRVEHKVRGLEGGADAYVMLPSSPGELVATVQALLRLKESENERALLLE